MKTLKQLRNNYPKDLISRGAENIDMGTNVCINHYCHFSAQHGSRITIGDNVNIGPFVVMHTADHIFADRNKLIMKQGHVVGDIEIGSDVWIGARATILRGSVIPTGCVIGACSLVTRHDELKEYGVYAGNPLRLIKMR